MPDKKKETSKSKAETEFVPTIVEVYGEEKHETRNTQLRQGFDEQAKSESEQQKEGDKGAEEDAESTYDGTVEDRPAAAEAKAGEGERVTLETLKTEVVGGESVVGIRESGVGGGATNNSYVKGYNQAQKPEKEDSKALDDKAFEEEIGEQKKVARSIFGVGVGVFLVIFGLTGWAFYLKTVWLTKETVTSVLVAEQVSPEETKPSPTPAPAPMTREEISLQILNGSGVVGLAGRTAQVFEELGYEKPETGNGETVKKTEFYIKKELESRLSVLLADVEKELAVASITGYLKDSDTVTARIVLAK